MRVRDCPKAVVHATKQLRSDYDFMVSAIAQNWRAIQYSSEAHRSCKAQDLELTRRCPRVSGRPPFAPHTRVSCVQCWISHRSDKRMMLHAVSLSWLAVRHASAELRGDKDFMTHAISKSWRAVHHASESLRADQSFMMAAVDAG
eukprot:1291069-Amphidinium_carterae.2